MPTSPEPCCMTLWHFAGGERWYDEGVRATLAAMAAAGFTHVNWNADAGSSYMYAEAEMDHAAELLAEVGLQGWAVHGSNGRNMVTEVGGGAPETRKDFLSPVGWQRQAGLELMRNRIALAARIGAPALVTHVDIPEAAFADAHARAAAFAILHASLDALADDCARPGVRIAVENLPSIRQSSMVALLEEALGRHPADLVGFCYDSGHAHLAAPGDHALLDAFGARLVTTHLHDNNGVRDEHLLPGDGTIDWTEVAQRLAASALPLPLTFETPHTRYGAGYSLSQPAFFDRARVATAAVSAAVRAAR